MKIYFSLKKTTIGIAFVILFVRLAVWQSHRHQEKLAWIETLGARLDMPSVDLATLANDPSTKWDSLPYRKVRISGTYIFENEMVLRNRKHNSVPGVFVLTPLKIEGMDACILVSRGFVPLQLSSIEKRKEFQAENFAKFIGLLKASTSSPGYFAPKDPDPKLGIWADEWLRVDIEKMQRQISCKLLPVYSEIMSTTDKEEIKAKIIISNDERSELLSLASRGVVPASTGFDPSKSYPIPVFDLVIPPARHLGYVYEWSFIAFITLVITLLSQLRPPRKN